MTITETPSATAKARQVFDDAARILDHLDAHADELAGLRPRIAIGAVGPFEIQIQCRDAEELTAATRVVQAGAALGEVKIERDDSWVKVRRPFGSVVLEAWSPRSSVCERKVVGTTTELVPDPDAPMVEREVEIVEWDCSPVLTGDREPEPWEA